MPEKMPEVDAMQGVRFMCDEETGRTYTKESYRNLVGKAEAMDHTRVTGALDAIIIDVSKYNENATRKLKEIRTKISSVIGSSGIDLKSAETARQLLRDFQDSIPGYSARHSPPTPVEQDLIESAETAKGELLTLRTMLMIKIGALSKDENLQKKKAELDAIWERSLATQKLRDAQQKQATNRIDDIKLQIGIETPQARRESRDRAIEIVTKDAGIRVNTSINSDLSSRNNAGFQNLSNRMRDSRSPYTGSLEAGLITAEERMRNVSAKDILRERNIREVIDIRHDMMPVLESVTIPGNKGIFGLGKTADRVEKRQTGRYEPVPHSEMVEGGKPEPGVRFSYYIPSSDDWRDYSGRYGQSLIVEMVLPESSAKELASILDKDPTAMREIVGRMMKEKLLKDPKAWETKQGTGDTLRPPYERWDREPGGGKIYVQQEGKDPGFREENLRPVRE